MSKPNVGIVVGMVIKGSLSEKAGLKEGDLIISLNGVPTRTHQEYINACDKYKNVRVLEVVRNERQFLTLNISLE